MLIAITSLLMYLYRYLTKRDRIAAIEDDTHTPEQHLPHTMNYLRLIKQYAKSSSLCLRIVDRGSKTTHSQAGWLQRVIHEHESRELSVIDPMIHIKLNDWTSYIQQQDYPEIKGESQNKRYIVMKAISDPPDTRIWTPEYTKVTDIAVPLAWRAGPEFSIMAECSEEGLAELTHAFMQDRLLLDQDALSLLEITSVSVEGHAVNLLRVDSSAAEPFANISTSRDDFNSQAYDIIAEADDVIIETVTSPTHGKPLAKFDIGGEEDMEVKNGNNENNDIIINDNVDYPVGMTPSSSTVSGDTQYFSTVSTLQGSFSDFDDTETITNGDNDNDDQDLSEGAGEAPIGSYPDSPAKYSQASSDDVAMVTGAGEALSPTVEDQRLLSDFGGGDNETSSKPPNVMVYSGKKDSHRLFDKLKETFALCFNPDKYILYNLKHEQIFNAPWIENTACLVIASDKIYDGIEKQFLRYFEEGGVLISFANNVDLLFCNRFSQDNFTGMLKLSYKGWKDVTVTCGKYTYGPAAGIECKLDNVILAPLAYDVTGNVVAVIAEHQLSGGRAILSQCNLDKDPTELAITPDIYKLLKQANASRFDVLRHLLGRIGVDSSGGITPPLTPSFLLTKSQNQKDKVLSSIKPRLANSILTGRNFEVQFVKNASEKSPVKVTADRLPIITHPEGNIEGFDDDTYFGNLRSSHLGNTVLFTDVITSTMPLMDALMLLMPDSIGLIAIANRQTAGKGRSGNAWLSPPGCAMFSLHVRTSLETQLGSRLSYLQHIASLAVVEAVCTIPGYEALDLRLKWPNDLYYGDSIKLGGVLVTSSIMGSSIHANIGIGVNVTNSNPTTCINDVIKRHNQSSLDKLTTLTPELVIARTVSQMDRLIQLFNNKGPQAFLERYYARWIHGGKTLRLESESDPEAAVQGLDDFGYLLVRLQDGSLHSVHPDGNSLDMTKNLIIPKETH